MSLEHAVEAFAGLMVLLSVALTYFVHPGFVWLTAAELDLEPTTRLEDWGEGASNEELYGADPDSRRKLRGRR